MKVQFAALLAALSIGAVAAPAAAQSLPPFATTKVEGTDNVYIFRNAAIRRCSSSPRPA